ncbi:MAG: sensor histidine kinase [Lachnospiraceae bacterium]|nr:sensor histidine kinase [Lachnospiraceae bacterium]
MRRTIKFKILSGNILIVCVTGLIFSITSYMTAYKKVSEVSTNSLTYHVESVSNVYGIAYDEMRNILINCTEGNLFDLKRIGTLNSVDQKRAGIDYARLAEDFCAVAGYGKYISRMSVFNVSGVHVSAGTVLGSRDDMKWVLETDWFWEELKKDIEYYPLDLVESPFYRDDGGVLPFVCRISGGSIEDSWAAIFLSPKLYADELKKKDSGNEMLVVTYRGERVAAMYEDPADREENDALVAQVLSSEEYAGIFSKKVHGKECMVAWNQDMKSGIVTIEILDMELLKDDRMMLIQTVVVILLACTALGIMLSIFFSRMVRRPIERLVQHIGHIGEGDFQQDMELEREDEIGEIGRCINNMSGQIEQLMKKKVEDEKEKKNLELQMLQAQINPHFLYNTLDSIKWIAVIQKNSGIIKAVTALSKLLKNMAKGFNEKVTVREELDFVNDYITLEKLKYAEMFDVQVTVEEPALWEAKIIKLTLQPLVENAIFSGIEPKGKNGLICIRVLQETDCLQIVVWDNGIGIPKEKVKVLLTEDNNLRSDRMSSIGIANVNRRIQLVYGENYGLSVESRYNEYTKVSVTIPLEYGGEDNK